jgi:hypothetical protein
MEPTTNSEQRLARACLAALARRASVALVVTNEEIEREYANGAQLVCVSDAGAMCVRISVREGRP